ncbi:MAG: hypothetical protein P4M11_07830 [Candidatus Pacebacteria bacterium]|nr:hypothetical protein [Candidatus Paceibacterota bacterium]
MLWLNAGLVVFDALWLLVTGYTWGQPSSMEGEALTLEGYDTAKRATIVSALINMAIKVRIRCETE